MRTPYQAASDPALRAALWSVGAAMALCGLYLRLQGAALETQVAPLGIVSYEFCWSAEGARAILGGWAGQEEAVRLQIWADMPFLLLYPAFSSLLAERWVRRARTLGAARWGSPQAWVSGGAWVSWASWAMSPLDLTENAMLLWLLEPDAPAWAAPLASTCASLKFAVLLVALAYHLAGALALRRPPPRPQAPTPR